MPAQPSSFDIEVFFDGDCSICSREIDVLASLDRHGRILFTDIAVPGFEPTAVGLDVSWGVLMAEIHGRLPDGSVVTGVEVFRRLYAAVGFGPAVALTRLPGVRHSLDVAYDLFARNRLRLTGRCADGTCQLPAAPRLVEAA